MMRYFKILGLAALATAALTTAVGANAAFATVLESSGGNLPKGTQIEATGTNFVLKAGFATAECNHSELDGKTSNAGGAGESVEGNVNNLSFTGCNAHITVTKKGRFIFEWTSGRNLTVTWEGIEIDISIGGTTCTYGAPTAKHVGTISGGSPAAWPLSASLTRIGGGFLCANPASWTATYTVTTPNPLYGTAS